MSKAEAKLTDWLKDLAPSTELRRWFGHKPARWSAFRLYIGPTHADGASDMRRSSTRIIRGSIGVAIGAGGTKNQGPGFGHVVPVLFEPSFLTSLGCPFIMVFVAGQRTHR